MRGFSVIPKSQVKVHYKGNEVGEYYPDLEVNGLLILELKAVEHLLEEHEAQLLNYLRATEIEVGLLLNFGVKPQFARKIYMNDKKKLKR